MRFDVLIRRAVLSTLAGILALLALMFGVLSLFFPQTMMHITYKMGMDKASVGFALTAYDRFGMVDYVGFAANTALKAELHDKAELSLERLLQDENYEEYCERRNEERMNDGLNTTFQEFYPRQLCLSVYWQGEGERAIERALELMDGSFEEGNPFVIVVNRASKDDEAGALIVRYAYEQMETIAEGDVYEAYSETSKAYFDQVYTAMRKLID